MDTAMPPPSEELPSYASSIDLLELNTTMFRNLASMNQFALDIGGSLAKIAYQTKQTCRKSSVSSSTTTNGKSTSAGKPLTGRDLYRVVEDDMEEHRLCFIKFETCYLETCLDFIRDNLLLDQSKNEKMTIKVTGGGAYRYSQMIRDKLNVDIEKEDEVECLVKGCTFLLKNIPDEAFTYERNARPAYSFTSSCLVAPFPFLLVNIGSGVSILEVDSDTRYSRIGGTSLGGGTFWGIGAFLTGGQLSFDELLELADRGDHRRVDMLVKDICGGPNESLELSEEVIASSFGLAAKENCEFKSEDVLKSLLITVSNNIGQIAYLHAKRRNLKRILFGGYFIRGHPTTMDTLSYAVNFWSAGSTKAMFLRHEGYLGAVGAFLKSLEATEKASWSENYFGSSASTSPVGYKMMPSLPVELVMHQSVGRGSTAASSSPTAVFDKLELERLAHRMAPFPLLLNASSYVPDTWDITGDKDARDYWLTCLEAGVGSHQRKAFESQASISSTAEERSHQYINKYVTFLHELSDNPSAYGVLTVRCLLDAHQNFLREFGFTDPFSLQKKIENEAAIAVLPKRLEQLSQLGWRERQEEVVKGMLTGNVFDWGAQAIVNMIAESDDGIINFELAESKLQQRPWLYDDLEKWIARLEDPNMSPHRCVLIFCDNSGFDLIMGVLPFVLECLARGSRVILAANSDPAINDITYFELALVLNKLAGIVPAIHSALHNHHLIPCETGTGSPCLDLRCVATSLVNTVLREGVDLVLIEGMGRAVHTNLLAQFNCDSLKIAVIKNAWLAKHLGGELFSAVFKYEESQTSSTATLDFSV